MSRHFRAGRDSLLYSRYDAKLYGAPVLAITGPTDHDLIGAQCHRAARPVSCISRN
jgi:hypothetical protein